MVTRKPEGDNRMPEHEKNSLAGRSEVIGQMRTDPVPKPETAFNHGDFSVHPQSDGSLIITHRFREGETIEIDKRHYGNWLKLTKGTKKSDG
jgi:hypothetical protein